MKTETLLLIAGAVGVGYLIAKKKAESATIAASTVAAAPRVALLPEPPGAIVGYVEPEYVPYPVYGGSWGPSWGSYRGGGRHHGGGHHHGGGRRR
jgi:hypothetical protein